MGLLKVSFFTTDVLSSIRANGGSDMNLWKMYRTFHNTMEEIPRTHAVQVLREFQNMCDTISTLPDEHFERMLHNMVYRVFVMKLYDE